MFFVDFRLAIIEVHDFNETLYLFLLSGVGSEMLANLNCSLWTFQTANVFFAVFYRSFELGTQRQLKGVDLLVFLCFLSVLVIRLVELVRGGNSLFF